mgnify:CR=1 FL=1
MAISRAIDYYSGNTQNRVYRSISAPAGWSDAKYRVITSRAPFSETFLAWLDKYATKAVGGTWVLNEDTNVYPSIPMSAQFVSNGQLFYGLSSGPMLSYWVNSDASDIVVVVDEGGVWVNTAYRTIQLLEPPTDELLTWLNYCGVKQT